MRYFFIIICFFLLIPPLYSNENPKTVFIYSGHPNYPPFMWVENNRLTGAGVKLVEEIVKILKLPAKPIPLDSWERAQQMAKTGEVDMLVGAYKNKIRMQYMAYSIAYIDDPTCIFIRKDTKFEFHSLDDLIGKKGLGIYGESYGEKLDNIIKEKLTLHYVYNKDALFSNLKQGIVDYVIWGYYPWILYRDTSSWCKIIKKPVAIEGMHITISKKSSLIKYLPQINRIIRRFQKQGKIKNWMEEYAKKYKLRFQSSKK